ncbi:hypothetical protein CKM354_001104900 [Cercospora kikuchii]|uniref:F-box domain-containing protein n=1 Tax=Cercospora kikuchii TaxID=84275 RepID=A0A9P3CS82_9PEZI|nr:uncharacterized protein CKM354_001104900 [Cercospora kikuchii]GIZ47974.1 hypothetical protein CKM354_001104900 [Cercospora kikuchii]
MHSPVNLLSLPAEVRLIIYSFVLTDEWTYINSCGSTSQPLQDQPSRNRLPSLLRTCQLLRQEATAVYYSNLQVHFDICNGIIPLELITWLDEIGETNAALLRHFELRWGNYADISLDLRCRTSKPKPSSKNNRSEAILIQTYHRRLSAVIQQSLSHKTSRHDRQLFLPLLQLATGNPTTSIQRGKKHTLSVKGVPLATAIHPCEFWEINGTAEFCRILSKSLSDWLEDNLTSRGVFKDVECIMEFVTLANEHASALRWLGYW